MAEIHKEIKNNQISILNYKAYEDIGSNFDFSDNPIEEIIYITSILSCNNDKYQKQNFNNFPAKLQILKLYLTYVECYKLDNLPSELKKLYLPNSYCFELDNLPLGLEELFLLIDSIFKMVCGQQSQYEIDTRVFTFGLGSQASKQFIKGLSDLTFGDYAMIGDSEDLLEPVKKIISTVNKQYYTGVELVFESEPKPNSQNVEITYTKINSVYPGKTYSMICEVGLNMVEELKSSGLKLEGYNPIVSKPVEWIISLDTIGDKYFDYSIIKQLYWNEQIRQMEKSIQFDWTQINNIEEQIIKISVENSIMNKYTSFVLVDKSGEFDVEQIGKDLVVPNLSSSTTGYISKPISISSILSLNKNASHNIRGGTHKPSTHTNPFTKSNDYDNSISYSDPMNMFAGDEEECCNGIDMFGGGGGHWVLKHIIFINWYNINKLKNITNGSYKFESDG